MNKFQLRKLNELLEPEEIESWELEDFDDVLQGYEVSELEYEFTCTDSFGFH